MRALGDELHTVRVAHESAESQLQQAIGKLQRIEAEYRDREAEFMSNLRTKNDDIARLSAALAQERKDKVRATPASLPFCCERESTSVNTLREIAATKATPQALRLCLVPFSA